MKKSKVWGAEPPKNKQASEKSVYLLRSKVCEDKIKSSISTIRGKTINFGDFFALNRRGESFVFALNEVRLKCRRFDTVTILTDEPDIIGLINSRFNHKSSPLFSVTDRKSLDDIFSGFCKKGIKLKVERIK